jgi:hypothetical protein
MHHILTTWAPNFAENDLVLGVQPSLRRASLAERLVRGPGGGRLRAAALPSNGLLP